VLKSCKTLHGLEKKQWQPGGCLRQSDGSRHLTCHMMQLYNVKISYYGNKVCLVWDHRSNPISGFGCSNSKFSGSTTMVFVNKYTKVIPKVRYKEAQHTNGLQMPQYTTLATRRGASRTQYFESSEEEPQDAIRHDAGIQTLNVARYFQRMSLSNLIVQLIFWSVFSSTLDLEVLP
jgi:hypothetical protein